MAYLTTDDREHGEKNNILHYILNHVLWCSWLGQVVSLYINPVHSAV